MSTQPPKAVEPEVTGVVKMVNGGRVPYVVVIPDEEPPLPEELKGKGDITFALKVWEDTVAPEAGQVVVLSKIRTFDKGLRAMSARPITLNGQ